MSDDVFTRGREHADVPGSWAPSRVVVGVDGTAANYSAITWAEAEARRARCPLVLLGVGSGDTPPTAPRTENLEREHIQRQTQDVLETVRHRVLSEDLEIQIDVAMGEPSHALVRSTDERDLVVVGKRGGHPMARTVLGSTSIATVGRTRGPVVVVPEHWSEEKRDSRPVVVGLRERSDDSLLGTALTRASDLGVGLVVVRSWDMPIASARSPEDVVERGTRKREGLESSLAPWLRRYPDVPMQVRCEPLAPAVALLGEATVAQLLVLGRHTRASHPGGLSLGSTTRRVLHHTRCPVLVVPMASTAESAEPFDDSGAPEY